jgi:hypothetical protein
MTRTVCETTGIAAISWLETKHMLLYYLPRSLSLSLPQLPNLGILQSSKQAVLLRCSMPYLLSYNTELGGRLYER